MFLARLKANSGLPTAQFCCPLPLERVFQLLYTHLIAHHTLFLLISDVLLNRFFITLKGELAKDVTGGWVAIGRSVTEKFVPKIGIPWLS